MADSDPIARRYAESDLPTRFGTFRCRVFRDARSAEPTGAHPEPEHVALFMGDLTTKDEPVLCRVHSSCLTGETFGSTRCDCRQQLDGALEAIAKIGRGVVIYLQQEGRGIGLGNKIRAYELQQEDGFDTVDANRELGLPDDLRSYQGAAGMLRDLGVDRVRLMTNNPAKVQGLEAHGIEVAERVPHLVEVGSDAADYVKTKQARMGHLGGLAR